MKPKIMLTSFSVALAVAFAASGALLGVEGAAAEGRGAADALQQPPPLPTSPKPSPPPIPSPRKPSPKPKKPAPPKPKPPKT